MNKTSVKPEILYIDDLIFGIKDGKYTIPAFQRGYVWEIDNIIELFDSIYNGYPIGSVLLWETELNIESSNIFDKGLSSTNSLLVLDGQQRLTTLYNCLSGNKDSDIWSVYIDLNSEKFVHIKNGDEPAEEMFPVSKVINTTDFLKESKRLFESTGSEKLLTRAEKFANTIRKYKLSTILLLGGSIDSAIEIFTRLNRTGVEILSIDIIKALNYDQAGEDVFSRLNTDLINILEEKNFVSEEKRDKVYSDCVIRTIRVALEYQLYAKDDTVKLSHQIRSEEFKLLKPGIVSSFENTVNYLSEVLKFRSFNELPYSALLYIVFSYFYFVGREDSECDLVKLERVIYRGSITELYAGSPSVTEKLIEFFKSNFNESILTEKLKEQLSDRSVETAVKKVYNSNYKSQSAVAKILFNLVKRDSRNQEELCRFPPINLYKDSDLKNYIGNKVFYFPDERDLFDPSNIIRDIELRKDYYLSLFNDKYKTDFLI